MIAIVFLCVGTRHVSAELRLAGIFADQMVLQRDQPIHVWGWAEAGDKVTVILVDQTETTIANEHGTWSVTLKSSEADSQCRQLRVESR